MKAPLFLRAKHWQIFVPLMVIPFITMIIFMMVTVASMIASRPEGPEDVIGVFYFMPFITLICAATQFLWIWNVAVNLRKYIQSPERKPRIMLFRFTFFIPLVYICFIPFLMVNFLKSVAFGHSPNPAEIIPFALTIFFGNLLMMFCFLNNNYVVAKTIKMAELQRKVTFGDFVGDFFFMLIFPVAIWFIQPRINKIVNGEEENISVAEQKVQRDILD